MMKLFATTLILLVLSCLTMAQQAKMSVIWSSDANCDARNSPEVKILQPTCSSVQLEDVKFYIINYNGVSYAMSSRTIRDYLVASVQISNKGIAPLEINMKRARIGRYASATDYGANSKAAYASAQSQDNLRQASYREGEIGEKEGGIRSGLKMRDKYEVDYNRGRYVRRPGSNIDEPEAPPTEAPVPSSITSELLIPKIVFDNILRSRTLAIGEKAAGHIVFKNPSEEKAYVVLYLNAGPIEFVFPAEN